MISSVPMLVEQRLARIPVHSDSLDYIYLIAPSIHSPRVKQKTRAAIWVLGFSFVAHFVQTCFCCFCPASSTASFHEND
jgi:hypothetical protein